MLSTVSRTIRSGVHLHTEWPLAIIYQKNTHSVIYIRGGNGPSAHPLHPAPGFTAGSVSAPLHPIISHYFTRLSASVPACSSLYLKINSLPNPPFSVKASPALYFHGSRSGDTMAAQRGA